MSPIDPKDVRDQQGRPLHGAAARKPTRSPEPLPGITHGLSGYAQGCGCQACREAKIEYARDLRVRQRRKDEDKQTLRAVVDLSPRVDALVRHQAGEGREASRWIWQAIVEKLERDTDYRHWKMRRASRARPVVPPAVPIPDGLPEDDDRTIPVSVSLTPRADALIKEQGGTRGGWIWEAILEKLERDTGYVDAGRRRAPRRRNVGPA